ncbi:hypothetical protein HY605_02175, partial [Candidatus Peregrinibacteria bacterium]|nr:hypothetical protein [Candidatus Peregrinibacteria bacterium]
PDIGADEYAQESGALSGTYTVSTNSTDSPTWGSIGEAVVALCDRGVGGAVTINVKNGNWRLYDGELVFRPITGVSSANKVTFQADTNNTPIVWGYNKGADIFGADWVTFKGFTLKNARRQGVHLLAKSGDNPTNNTIQSNAISDVNSLGLTGAAVAIGGAYASNTIYSNTISKGAYGAFTYGIDIAGSTSTDVDRNTISGFSGANSTSSAAIVASGASNGLIRGNTIAMTVTGTAQYGIRLASSTSGMQVYNNMIYGSNNSWLFAISLENTSTSNQIYFNSVRVTYTGGSAQSSAALYFNTSGTGNYVKNNIFGFEDAGTSAANGKVYGFYKTGTGSFISDYNDFWRVSIPTKNTELAGYYTSDRKTLGEWRSATSGDINSIDQDPYFVWGNNLLIQRRIPASPVKEAGVWIATVPIDVEDDVRTNPNSSIGADEVVTIIVFEFFSNIDDTSPVTGARMRVLVNGTSQGIKITDAQGKAEMKMAGLSSNDTVLVYRDDVPSDANDDGFTDAATVTVVPNNDVSMKIYVGRVTIRNDNSGNTANVDIKNAKGSYPDADIEYSVGALDVLTVTGGQTLLVKERDWQPTANVNIPGLEVYSGITARVVDNITMNINTASASKIYGSLDIISTSAPANLQLADSATLTVQSGGILRMLGASTTNYALVKGDATPDYKVTVASGGIIYGNYFWVENSPSGGQATLTIANGSVIRRLDHGTFVNSGAGASIDLTAIDGSDRWNKPYGFHRLSFDGSSGYNIKADSSTPVVNIFGNNGSSNGRWGESYDDDPYDRVKWWSDVIGRMSGATIVEKYNTFEEALADTDVVNNTRLRQIRNIPLSEPVDLEVSGKDVVIENAIFSPMGSKAVFNTNADPNLRRGRLRNCIILTGGVDRVTLQNCTLFRPYLASASSYAMSIEATNSTIVNSILQNGANTAGSTVTTSMTTATDALFKYSNMLDFHINPTGTGATQVINQGSDLTSAWNVEGTPITDFEGHSRTSFGSAWDKGVDEYTNVWSTPTVVQEDWGNIKRVFSAGTRNGVPVSYMVTAGGSTNGISFDNKLRIINMNNFSVIATYNAPGPIWYVTSYGVTASPYERRVFIVVDALDSSGNKNPDGKAETIIALIDWYNGSSYVLEEDTTGGDDSNPATYDGFGGQDIYDYDGDLNMNESTGARRFGDGSMRSLSLLRFDGEAVGSEANNAKRGRRLIFISGDTLYKVNADPQDGDDSTPGPEADNKKYGLAIWSDNTQAKYDWNGNLVFFTDTNNLFIPISDPNNNDALPNNGRVVVRVPAIGNIFLGVQAGWKAGDNNYQNFYGVTADPVINGKIRIYTGPSSGSAIYSADSTSSSGEWRWISPALGLTGDKVNSTALKYFTVYQVLAGVGEYVYKLQESTDEPPQASDGQAIDTDWPFKAPGGVSTAVRWSGGSVYYGTKQGFCYII